MILYIETMNNQKKTKYSYRIYKKYSPFLREILSCGADFSLRMLVLVYS